MQEKISRQEMAQIVAELRDITEAVSKIKPRVAALQRKLEAAAGLAARDAG